MNTKLLDNLITMVSVLHTEKDITCTLFKASNDIAKLCKDTMCVECIFYLKTELPEIINVINKELDRHEQISEDSE